MGEAFSTFADSLTSFFKKQSVWTMIAFAFLYRTSQGFLDKIGPLFMIDVVGNGGLGLNNEIFGWINGTVGTVGFVVGSLLGGWFVSRRGLKRVLILLCLAINVPNATYIYLGLAQPESVWLIGSVVTLEKFWFGFGAVGHMLYMMQQLAPGPYKTAHYAFGTALMGLVMMLTGMASGSIYEAMGYVGFFIFVMAATLPSFVVTFLAPFHVAEAADPPSAKA
jgi:PAT family beta-lactamase induction signal transducer AmpG